MWARSSRIDPGEWLSCDASRRVLYYSPHGGVAQLGERSVRNAEVRGSNPLTSTIHLSGIPRVNPRALNLWDVH